MKFARLLFISTLFIFSVSAQANPVKDNKVEEKNLQIVLDFYNTVFNEHKVTEGAAVLTNDYKQHNPKVPDGKEPFVSHFIKFFEKNPQSKAKIVRSSANEDLVWLHIHSTLNDKDEGRAIVDIFRVNKGKIVEHWDVIQSVPKESMNKNSMF